MKKVFFWLLVLGMISCTGRRLATDHLEVTPTDDGIITGVQLSEGQRLNPFVLASQLAGCSIDGEVIYRENDDGSMEFVKHLVHDSLKASCVLIERYTARSKSIRCELIIKGDGEPWSTAIETELRYPVRDQQTRIWTAWGAPQFDEGKVADGVRHALRRIGPEGDDNNPRYWLDPLVPVPFSDATYYYGAPAFEYDNMRIGFVPFQENLISIPIVSVLDDSNGSGLTIALSPDDQIIDLTLNTTENGTVIFKRFFNRISEGNEVVFSFDLISHESDWRCGLDWMRSRYPEYFISKKPFAFQLDGTGAYSSFSMESMNFDIDKMRDMAFTVNWQASFDFPYMGVFLPPVDQNEKWRRYGGDLVSIPEMDIFAKKYRDNGFYVLSYFNVTEFGAKITYPPPDGIIGDDDPDLWKDANAMLYTKFTDAILPVPEKSIKDPELMNAKIPVPFYTWGAGIAMDCADSTYQNFLLDQAQRHVEEIPNSFGICIDRLDWVRNFNERADDGITWFGGKPARSLVNSWKNLAPKLSSIMHGADKVMFANNHSKRIDILQHIDGLFDEFTYSGAALNLTAFLCVSKPALGWTDNAETVRKEGGDSFFQKYLYMGVFPMCPFPNNDHSIMPSEDVDRYYLDYGPLMKLMQGSEWVLKAHVIQVVDNLAKANIFQVKDGYAVPVVYGEKEEVEVVINNLEETDCEFTCMAYHPGSDIPVEVKLENEGEEDDAESAPQEKLCYVSLEKITNGIL